MASFPQHIIDPHIEVEASLDLNIHNPLSLDEDVSHNAFYMYMCHKYSEMYL